MDIHVLNLSLERIELVETFSSFIWTERMNGLGDFELKVPTGSDSERYLTNGLFLSIDDSDRLMVIRRTFKANKTGSENMVTVVGSTIESVLKDRWVHPTVDGNWVYSGRPGVVGSNLVQEICVDGTGISPLDIVPHLIVETPDGSPVMDALEVSDGNLYSTLLTLANSHGMGLRIVFDKTAKKLRFKMFEGVDRSTTLKLGPDYDNLFNVRYNRDSTEYKNVAYVSHKEYGPPEIVYRDNHVGTEGFARRVIMVNADDIEAPTNQKLWRRGRDELGKYDYIHVSDGEIPPGAGLVYGRHYGLGDKLAVSYEDAAASILTVVEHIWSYDSQGLRAYPTLQYLET